MRVLAALVWKDLVIEARTRELVTSMSLVAFLALVILALANQAANSAARHQDFHGGKTAIAD